MFSKTLLRPWELKWMNLNTVSSQMCNSIIYYCVLLYNDSENLKICKVLDSSTCQSGFKKEINVNFWVKKVLLCGWYFQRLCLTIWRKNLVMPSSCQISLTGLCSTGDQGPVNLSLHLAFSHNCRCLRFNRHRQVFSGILSGVIHLEAVYK